MAALEGMRVLDLTQWEAGPTCTQYLAWMGADVVKVEPLRGEPGRRAFASGEGDSQYFMNHNGNKRAIAVDLKTESGRRIMQRLVPRFDVLVENQGPGVVERLGLGPDELLALNERLVYVRIKGYGLSGPYRDYKSFDPLAQAAAGVFSMTGTPDSPPLPPGGTFADTGTGIHSAFAVCAAFVQQQRTGRGQVIEVSMHEVMTMFIRTNASMNWGPGAAPTPRRPADGWPPSGLYRCKGDGPNDWVSVVIANRGMAEAFFDAVGRSELLEMGASPRPRRGPSTCPSCKRSSNRGSPPARTPRSWTPWAVPVSPARPHWTRRRCSPIPTWWPVTSSSSWPTPCTAR